MEIRARKNLDLSLNEYHEMLWKLGVDLEVCMKIGAILGKGTDEEIELLTLYGRNLGYLCRLYDEIDDVININKLPSRIEFESIPLLILYASKRSNENYETIKRILDNKVGLSELAKLIVICSNSGAFNYLKEIAYEHTIESINSLKALKKNSSLNKLEIIFRSITNDIKKMGTKS